MIIPLRSIIIAFNHWTKYTGAIKRPSSNTWIWIFRTGTGFLSNWKSIATGELYWDWDDERRHTGTTIKSTFRIVCIGMAYPEIVYSSDQTRMRWTLDIQLSIYHTRIPQIKLFLAAHRDCFRSGAQKDFSDRNFWEAWLTNTNKSSPVADGIKLHWLRISN